MADEAEVKIVYDDAPKMRIGVLRHPSKVYPNGQFAGDLARQIAGGIQSGGIICLPNTRDAHGDYEWDFRIEPVDEVQAEVQRDDVDAPVVVEKGTPP